MSVASLGNSSSRPPSVNGDGKEGEEDGQKSGGAGGKGHAKTECQCGKDGKHYSETALTMTVNSTPEKVYNLMFNSEWFKTWLRESQKLRGGSLGFDVVCGISYTNGRP